MPPLLNWPEQTALTRAVPPSTPGGGTSQHRPLVTRYQHAWPSSRRPSVGIRHGRPFAGVAKQVDAPRPERDALRRTAGSNPAAGTFYPRRRSSALARALTWYVRGRAFDSRRRLHPSRTVRAWRNWEPRPPQERSSRKARARSSRAARTRPRRPGSGVSRQRAGLPSRRCGIVARLPVQDESLVPG